MKINIQQYSNFLQNFETNVRYLMIEIFEMLIFHYDIWYGFLRTLILTWIKFAKIAQKLSIKLIVDIFTWLARVCKHLSMASATFSLNSTENVGGLDDPIWNFSCNQPNSG